MGNFGVGIERPVGGGPGGDAQLGEPVQNEGTVRGIPTDVARQLRAGVVTKGRDGADLRNCRGTNVEVADQELDRPHERRRQHEPADAPTRHREVLAHRADEDAAAGGLPRARCPVRERNAVVDLIADQEDVVALAPAGDRGQFRGGDDRSRRVGRRGEDQPGGRAAVPLRPVGEHREGRLEANLRTALEFDGLNAQSLESVAVSRVARPGHQHDVTDIEGGNEQRGEGGRRAGRHRDGRRVNGERIHVRVVRGDCLPERRDAGGVGVAEDLPAGERGDGGCADSRRGRGRGLPGAEGEDIAVGGGPEVGGLEQLHDVEGLDVPPVRHADPCHDPIQVPRGLSRESRSAAAVCQPAPHTHGSTVEA